MGFVMELAKSSFRKKLIADFFDVIALKYIKDNGKLAGYDFMTWVHERYGVMLSSGTVYTKIYGLERRGLVKGEWGERKRVYALTKKGEATFNSILSDPMAAQFVSLLENSANK
jgi:DNA-binding PadR family transcriptional regulator